MRIMRSIVTVVILLSFILIIQQVGLPQERVPSTPEERTKAIQTARSLEMNPLSENAKADRRWFTAWLIRVPDIHVSICTTLLGPLLKAKKNYSGEIFTQMIFSSASFIIENPEQGEDKIVVSTAGLKGSLKVYEAILQSKPEARSAFLDELIEMRDNGTLVKYVRDNSVNCK